MLKKKEYLSKLLKIKINTIKDEHIKYFYTKYPEWCCNINDPPLFENIKEYDYLTPIKNLADYYDNEDNQYFTNLLKNLNKKKFNKKTIANINNPDIDQMLLQYINCRSNCQILTIYPELASGYCKGNL